MSTTEALRDLTAAELDEMLVASLEDAALLAQVTREYKRRAKVARERARRAAVRAEWELGAHAQYLEAEAACNGNLVRKGAPVTDAWQLWTNTDEYAMAHCTEELAEFWQQPGCRRVTATEYARQHAAALRDEREAATATEDAETEITETKRQESHGTPGLRPAGAARQGHRPGRHGALPAAGQVRARDRHADGRRCHRRMGRHSAPVDRCDARTHLCRWPAALPRAGQDVRPVRRLDASHGGRALRPVQPCPAIAAARRPAGLAR